MDLWDEVQALKKRRRNVKWKELDRLLKRAGFDRRPGKGDHWIYTHPGTRFRLSIDPRTTLLPAYLTDAIRALEDVLGE